MVVVERLEYQLTEDLLRQAAASVVPEFVPPATPRHSPQLILQLLALAALCVALLVVGVVFKMPTEHYIVTGFGVASCLFAAAFPWATRSINNGLIRFTRFSQKRVHDRLLEVSRPSLGSPVRWEFDEEGFRTQLLDTVRRVAWTELKRVRMRPQFWFFATKRDQLMFPTAVLTDSVRDLIRRKTAEAHVRMIEG